MSKNNIFEMSKGGKSEYCVNVVKIGTLKPIEGSDFLAQTFIGDASVVVRKDQVKEGDFLFYASNECQLNEKFLSVNNLFEVGCYEKNANAEEVNKLSLKIKECEEKIKTQFVTTEDSTELAEINAERDKYKAQIKSMCGFFKHNGRVRMIRLKKTPSMGYLFSLDEMVKYCPKAKSVNMEDYLNVDFDTVDGELFVKAYMPPIRGRQNNVKNGNKRDKKLKRFDRMIEVEFSFHYDTSQLGKNMWQFNPDDIVTISCKIHGTSVICANIKVKNPIHLPFYQRWYNNFVDNFECLKKYRITDFVEEYDNIYSSRSVIKNQFINENGNENGYYKFDIWNEANEILKPFITDGMTVYGEICGYADNSPIQGGYDYGCKPGEFFIMPYRIVTNKDGKKTEWEVVDVHDWTKNIITEHPELANKIRPIQILYYGTLSNLYPDVKLDEHWHENILLKMMNDKEHFGMEELEPLCKNKCYREGIVIRKYKDPLVEAFKLKCKNFLMKEASLYDNGEVDIEAQQEYN